MFKRRQITEIKEHSRIEIKVHWNLFKSFDNDKNDDDD